jgi:hypothetical protein
MLIPPIVSRVEGAHVGKISAPVLMNGIGTTRPYTNGYNGVQILFQMPDRHGKRHHDGP